MKKILGLLVIVLVLVIAFLGLNFIWGWVDIDLKMIGKSGLTLFIAGVALVMIIVMWYVFMRKSSYHAKPDKPQSRAQVKDN